MTKTFVIIAWLCFAARTNKFRELDKRVSIWVFLGTSSKIKTWFLIQLFLTEIYQMNMLPTSLGLWAPACMIVCLISSRIRKTLKAWTHRQDLWFKTYLLTLTDSQTLLAMASITLTLKLGPSNESLMLRPVKCETTLRSFSTTNKTLNRWVPNRMVFAAAQNSSSSQVPDSRK